MQKSIIPMFAVMCVAVTTHARSNAPIFARVGATAEINHARSLPYGCLWESYCDESKPICHCRGRRGHACGGHPLFGSACCKSSCTQKQHGCNADCNTCSQRNGAGIIRSRPSTPAPQYTEPWPTVQDSCDSFEHAYDLQPMQDVLPQDRRVPRNFLPDDLEQNTLPHNDLPTTQRRPRRLTGRRVSHHTVITTPSRSRHITKSSPPVPQSAHQPPRSVHSHLRTVDQWRQQSKSTRNVGAGNDIFDLSVLSEL